jgi:DNA topoisomerase I
VLAAAFPLLDVGAFRAGNDRYAEENGSYGLMSLLREHVRCGAAQLTFEYPAKSGQERLAVVAAEPAMALVRSLHRGRPPRSRLLAFKDRSGWHELDSADLNEYLVSLFGRPVSAKDFRTWHGTVLAAVGLAVSGHVPPSPAARKRAVSRVVAEVAGYLGNTPAVCRKSYIDGRLIDRYMDGESVALPVDRLGIGVAPGWPAVQGPFEAAVLKLLAS